MSEASPPSEFLPIFNPANFPGTTPSGIGSGGGGGGAPSLNFPTAQGTETFPNGIIFGDGTYTNSAPLFQNYRYNFDYVNSNSNPLTSGYYSTSSNYFRFNGDWLTPTNTEDVPFVTFRVTNTCLWDYQLPSVTYPQGSYAHYEHAITDLTVYPQRLGVTSSATWSPDLSVTNQAVRYTVQNGGANQSSWQAATGYYVMDREHGTFYSSTIANDGADGSNLFAIQAGGNFQNNAKMSFICVNPIVAGYSMSPNPDWTYSVSVEILDVKYPASGNSSINIENSTLGNTYSMTPNVIQQSSNSVNL